MSMHPYYTIEKYSCIQHASAFCAMLQTSFNFTFSNFPIFNKYRFGICPITLLKTNEEKGNKWLRLFAFLWVVKVLPNVLIKTTSA